MRTVIKVGVSALLGMGSAILTTHIQGVESGVKLFFKPNMVI